MTEPVVWCGIDPGLAKMGVAFLLNESGRWRPLHVETVTTKASEPMHQRMLRLHGAIVHQQRTGYPLRVRYVVESQEAARVGARKRGESNFRADMVERVIGMIWELSLMCLYSAGDLIELDPVVARKHVGLPKRATKEQIAMMVRRIVPGLPEKMSEHASDAVELALGGERHARMTEMLKGAH